VLTRNNKELIGAGIALVLLSGCSGAGTTPSTSRNVSNAAPLARAVAATSGNKSNPLAYVIDSSGDVNVYSYPGFVQQQTLAAFEDPRGECVDSEGNVWIADAHNYRLVEYAHGGTQPIATLSDPAGVPSTCAVSSSSGTLAVGNFVSQSYGEGNVALYAHAKGKPKIVKGSPGAVYFLAYDSHDNLFADDDDSVFALLELAKGSTAFQNIEVKGATVQFAGALQYVNNVLNIGDQAAARSYQARVKNGVANVTGFTELNGSMDCVASFIYKNRLLCPDAGSLDLKVYEYPKGGNFLTIIPNIDGPIVISADSK
jgi:hypothetical protein